MQNEKRIIIIGGGVAGLSAGIYAEQHGFHAVILEKNPVVGGMCVGWNRKGYYLDGCIHWLTGTKEGTFLNEMWKNVGAFKTQDDILYLDSWGTFEYEGQSVTLWRDLDRAEREWKELSPVDSKMIHKFFKMVRDFTKVELPLDLPLSMIPLHRKIALGLKVLSVWPSYLATMTQSCEQFAAKFKSPVIRFALEKAQIGAGNLFSMIYSYATVVAGDGGVPIGASTPMVERMKEKFLSLGGALKVNANVDSVIVENGVAKGIKLINGEEFRGDYVVSCLDTNYTLKRLLRDQYRFPAFQKRFDNPKRNPAPSCVMMHFAIDKNSGIPTPYSFNCDKFYCGGLTIDHLTIRNYAYDESFTRGDKTILSVMVDQSSNEYAYWRKLSKNRNLYLKMKNEIANDVKTRILARFPELKDIELLDVCTPHTFNRYVNTSYGVYMSFLFTKKDPMFAHSGTVRGLRNFYLSGQWMQGPGGLPIAMTQGKFAIQRICKKEKLSFVFSPIPVKKKA